MSQHVFAAPFDKHPLTSAVQDGRFKPTSLVRACFPSAPSRAEGKEQQPQAFATTLSADDAHANPALATCSPHPRPSHCTSVANFLITSENRVTAKLVLFSVVYL